MDKESKRAIRSARLFAAMSVLLGTVNMLLLLPLVDVAKVGWFSKVMIVFACIAYLAIMVFNQLEEHRIAKAEKESAKLETGKS